jgi:hypothetical protein
MKTIDEKTTKLLLKLRKGADASLSLPQLFKVLALLGGWTVEEIVALTPLHYVFDSNPVLALICVEGEETGRRIYDLFAARVVTALPVAPEMGESYVMALEAFGPKPYYRGNHFGAQFQLWVGTPGYRITTPTGEEFDVAPSRHDFQGNFRDLTALPTFDVKALKRRLRTWDAFRWLKVDTSYLNQINALLGLEAHVPAAERTRENTGTCPCCFRNIKLDHDHKDRTATHPTMALHGYQRPGDGEIRGRCTSSAGFAPYELSPAGTAVERDLAEQRLANRLASLARLQNPAIVEFAEYRFRQPPVMHRRGDLDWTRQLENAIRSAEYAVKTAKDEHVIYGWLVEHWERRALPEAGKPEPHYYADAARAVSAAK